MGKKKWKSEPELPPTTHYVLQCFGGSARAQITRPPNLEPPLDNWIGGERFDVNVPAPLIFEIDEDDEGALIPFFNEAIPLMRFDLVKAMREAGVDNLDDYPAIIRETRTGKENKNYRVINVIGAVRAANIEGSDVDPSAFGGEFMIAAFFRRLQLDESAAQGYLMFRLAESLSAILVHDTVRQHLLRSGWDSLTFTHPLEWSG
jgi:hypothetical protein